MLKTDLTSRAQRRETAIALEQERIKLLNDIIYISQNYAASIARGEIQLIISRFNQVRRSLMEIEEELGEDFGTWDVIYVGKNVGWSK